jgi:hypothetical protein
MTMMLGPSKAVLSGELAATEQDADEPNDNGVVTADAKPATDPGPATDGARAADGAALPEDDPAQI